MARRAKRGRARCPRRGRRYTPEQRAQALAWAKKHGVASAIAKFGVSEWSLRHWGIARAPRVARAPEAGAAQTRSRAPSGETTRRAAAPSAEASAPPAAAPTVAKAPRSAAERARHGHRFSPAEKKAILEHAAQHGVGSAATTFGASRWSVYEWQRRQKAAKTQKQAQQALEPRSSAPKHNAKKISEERYHLVAETWLRNQALGPRQVRNQVRRDHGLRVGTSTVRRILEEHGYVPPVIKVERKVDRRYEAVRPNQQLHFDFVQWHVHKAKVYLLLIEDDFSRFIVGWALCEGERAQPVIEAFEAAMARHGKPEQIVVDGGSAFFSWRGESQLERVCRDYGIDFIKAKKGGANGKLEALNANVRKELLSRVEFADIADARVEVARFVRGYNYDRTHEGLGGLLVPADRYFGRTDEVLAQLGRGEAVVPLEAAPLAARALDLFRVVSRGGRPELWLFGQRLWPPAEPTVP